MSVNLMGTKKEMRKPSLVLWATSFALLMQVHPLGAMDKSETLNQSTKGLRDHNYYKAELRKLEESTRRIHKEVDRILREFRENMEKYYQFTRGKGVMAQSKEEIARQMRLDEAIALALDKELEVDENFTEMLRFVLGDNQKMELEKAIEEATIEMTKQQQGYAQLRSTRKQETLKEEEIVKKLIVEYMQKRKLFENHAEIEKMATNDIENFVKNYSTDHKSASRSEAIEALKGHVEASLKNLEEERKQPISNNSHLRPQSLLATGLQETKEEWKKLWMKFTETLTQAEEKFIKTRIVQQEEDEIIELTFADPDTTKTTSFLTCPTLGDGDCFFHAAFTENDTDKAEGMRKDLWKSIQEDEKAKELIPFMAEQYLDLIQNARKKRIPLEEFEQLLPNTTLPQAVQNAYSKWKGIRLFFEEIEKLLSPTDVERYIERLLLTVPIPDLVKDAYKQKGWKLELSEIESITTPNDVRKYMKQLKTVSEKLESFIPLDSSPFIKIEPASLLAAQEKKQIRIFVRIPNTSKLELLKTVGNQNDPIINLLQSGVHYTRLYTGNENEKPNCLKIIKNSLFDRGWETLNALKESGKTTKKNRKDLREALNKLLEAY